MSRITDPMTGWTPDTWSEVDAGPTLALAAVMVFLMALGVWLLAIYDEKRARRRELEDMIDAFVSAVAEGDIEGAEQAAAHALGRGARGPWPGSNLDGAPS